MKTTIWYKLQNLDSRILYGILLVFIIIPLLLPFKLPIIPSEQSVEAYNTVEEVAHETPIKPALVDSLWSASTRGENEFQTDALLQHMMERHIPFIVLPGDPQAPQLMGDILKKYAPQYHYVYGRDYLMVGYKNSNTYTQMIKGMVRNIPDTLKTDSNGVDLHTFPLMQHVTNFQDISMLVEITPSASLDSWLQFLQGNNKVPIVYASTAVQAPDAFPYLDSGQISGLLVGVKGAGDYEQLTGIEGGGTKVSTALSLVYALIILLIVLGNIGYFAGRRAAAQGKNR